MNIGETKIRFKLLNGRHICGKRTVKTGETFDEYPSKVEWMKHRLQPLAEAGDVEVANMRALPVLKKEHRGQGKYWIINAATGKPVNDTLMSGDEADQAIINLMGGSPDETKKGDEE